MDYTKATLISSKDYLLLINPIFEGQTKCNENGDYTMYFTSENKLYKINKNILD